jgi:hypothetical protein
MSVFSAISVAQIEADEATQSWWRRALSFPVFLGLMLVLAVFACVRTTPFDPDTWWHLTVGHSILRTGTWPMADSYSYTASGNAWTAYEWGGEVLMALATQAGGLVGARVLLTALSSLFTLLLYGYGTLVCGNSKAAFAACALLLAPAALFFTLRPQLIGYVFLLVLLLILELFRRGKDKLIWLLPPLFLCWVNIHGSFAFGFLLLAVWWLSGMATFRWGGLQAMRWTAKQRLWLELSALLSLLATFCTPYGTKLFSYPLEMALLQPLNIGNIREWQSLDPGLAMGKWFLVFVLGLFLCEVLLRPSHRLDSLTLLVLAVVIASLHRRFLIVFLVMFTPWLARLLSRWVPPYRPEKDKLVLNGVLSALGIVALVVFFPTLPALEQATAQNYPVAAVQYLEAHPVPEPMLNEYGWGGFLIYTRGSGHKVFIDGRADIYEYSGVLADYQDMMLLRPNVLNLLRKYDIRSCLLPRRAALGTLLSALPNWKVIYEDKVSVIFVNNSTHTLKAFADEAKPGETER